MQQQEVIEVKTKTVACDGGGGPLGHPMIYMTFKPGDTEVVCPYCSRTYKLLPGAKDDHH
ncbi:zinc-finger domain-containing protein [Telmatospirillum sp. J64-1]|uniref:zinc-finger domain-containing protein n=1 Tax=Telmatospirillum sp. J64-1 TaxID=2502183 RepID=UPI00115EB862|nr:zinc-finger domain-containing protein [Telmatospirillum sp. J64-1]